MVKRSLRRSALSVLAVAVSAALAAQPATPKKPKLTLDQQVSQIEREVRADGSVVVKRSFKHAIPWKEYEAALAAEQGTLTSATQVPLDDTTAIGGASASSAAATTCTPPDSDYDGDSFVGSADAFPLHFGEYVADRPKVVAKFTSFIEPGIDVLYSGSTTTTFESTRFYETDLVDKTEVVETKEIAKKFNTSFGFKWTIARGALPVISLDLGASGSVEQTHDFKWTRTKTNSVEQKFTDIRKKSQENTLSFGPAAGKLSGQVTIYNLSDYAITIDVTNLRIAAVAYSPFTGDKYALGDVAIPGTFTLGFGQGINAASNFVGLTGLNTLEMMNRLAEGWVWDMEIGSYTATDHDTGTNLSTIIGRVNQRNARTSIHYGFGSTTPRQYGQVAVFQPNSACLTGQALLTQFVGAANVEFDRLADGSLVVKRIFDRTNQFADRDFDTLTPSEQAQYGRWIVGFDYYTQLLTTFDLENTLLAPEDKVYFYFVTAQDFVQPPPSPDVTDSIGLANDGTAPASAFVSPESTYNTIELNVSSAFQIESAYSQSVGNIYNSHCGNVYRATYFGHRVTTDSTINNVTVPNVDWYGVQLNFGGRGWNTLTSLLADPMSKGSVTGMNGFPSYDFTVRFLATPAMLANYPTSSLQVRSANPRQTFSVGYDGYDVLGRRVSCRWNETAGFYHNSGSLKTWYKLDNVDSDLDGFYDVAKTGIDFDDANPRRFPYAPEMLDGVDNNGNGQIDESPMLCPSGLKSYDSGTCTLDNRMGWYPATPNTLLEQRFKHSDNTYTAWTTIGSGLTSYSFIMTSDPAITSMEIRTTYYPSGGGSFVGINSINHLPGGDVPLFPVGVDVEAESGRLVVPMRADTSGLDTYVSVPVGTYAIAPASADYRFTVVQAGDYVIWSRVYGSTAQDDSFIVMVFDPQGQPINFGYGTSAQFRFERANPAYTYGAFNWTRVGHWNPYVSPEEFMNPIFYHLVPGTYMVSFKPRELGARLDKLRLERYCPDNDLDGVTTCAGDCNDNNPNVYPGHAEVCGNGIDDNCNGYVDEGCGGGGGSPIFKKVVE